jgi:hypothetical protein
VLQDALATILKERHPDQFPVILEYARGTTGAWYLHCYPTFWTITGHNDQPLFAIDTAEDDDTIALYICNTKTHYTYHHIADGTSIDRVCDAALQACDKAIGTADQRD